MKESNKLFGFLIIGLLLGAFFMSGVIEYHRPDKDNVMIIGLLFGFATTNVAALLSKMSSQKGVDMLHEQNDVLEQQNRTLKDIQSRLSKLEQRNV